MENLSRYQYHVSDRARHSKHLHDDPTSSSKVISNWNFKISVLIDKKSLSNVKSIMMNISHLVEEAEKLEDQDENLKLVLPILKK